MDVFGKKTAAFSTIYWDAFYITFGINLYTSCGYRSFRDAMMVQTVSVLLPALNEEETIGSVIDAVPVKTLNGMGYNTEIVVVDGHSTDRTQEISVGKGARFVLQDGKGKGNALRSAFKANDADILFMMDSDNTYPPVYVIKMLEMLEKEDYDVVMGSRMNGYIEPGAMSTMNYLGNKVLSATANAFFPNGHKCTDVCTGMWGFRSHVIDMLAENLESPHFDVEAEMFAKCIKAGYNVAEMPIRYGRRCTPSKLGSLRDGAKIFKRLWTERFR